MKKVTLLALVAVCATAVATASAEAGWRSNHHSQAHQCPNKQAVAKEKQKLLPPSARAQARAR